MFRNTSLQSRRLFLAMVASALPAIFACGGGAGGGDANKAPDVPVCAVRADSALGGALDHFINTRTPPPQRFLIAMGTDSLIPDGSQYVLNALGRAVYMWPSDPAGQKTVIETTRSRGALPTMALFYHGPKVVLPDGIQQFTFSGLYTDLANNGKRVERTTINFNCQATDAVSRYTIAGSPAPAADQQPAPAAAPGRGGGG